MDEKIVAFLENRLPNADAAWMVMWQIACDGGLESSMFGDTSEVDPFDLVQALIVACQRHPSLIVGRFGEPRAECCVIRDPARRNRFCINIFSTTHVGNGSRCMVLKAPVKA